jgi:hypothetical protein
MGSALTIDSPKSNTFDTSTRQASMEMSICKLSGHPLTVLNLLAFFQPDAIDDTLILEGSKVIDDEKFREDEME